MQILKSNYTIINNEMSACRAALYLMRTEQLVSPVIFRSAVMVAGICNSVGGGFLTCHHGAGAGCKYRSVSKARVVNRKQEDVATSRSFPVVLECTNCSLHTTVGRCTK